jgi:hypothetical protein
MFIVEQYRDKTAEYIELAKQANEPNAGKRPAADEERLAITLDQAVALFTRELAGWWWLAGNSDNSAHASCGPYRSGPDGGLVDIESTIFDSGFHADLRQLSTPAQALLNVLEQAKACKAAYNNGPQAFDAFLASGPH